MLTHKTISALAIFTALAGCHSADAGRQYVGKWEETKQHVVRVKVRPNDGAHLADITSPGPFTTKVSAHTYPGSLKEGFLRVARDGIDDLTFAVDDRTGYLMGAGFEFARSE